MSKPNQGVLMYTCPDNWSWLTQCIDRVGDITDQSEIDAATPAEIFRAKIDLRDLRVDRIELTVREVRSEHQKRVAIHHGVIAGTEADQSGHPDVVRIVEFDRLLATQRVDDRRLERLRQLHQLVMRAETAAS